MQRRSLGWWVVCSALGWGCAAPDSETTPDLDASPPEDVSTPLDDGAARDLPRADTGADLGPLADTSPRADVSEPRDTGRLTDTGVTVDTGVVDPRDVPRPTDSGRDATVIPERRFDLVVVGAGSGGVAAAIQAARMGRTVALLEETDLVGGQMTAAAVSTMDGAGADPTDGLYGEFVAAVRSAYGTRPLGTCYWSDRTVCFQPSVGARVLRAMLSAEGRVTLFERARVDAVDSVTSGGRTRVTGVVATDASGVATRYSSAVVIDATEQGDVVRLSPARWRAGNSRSDAPGGVDTRACVQDVTHVAVVRRYPGGVPAALRIASPPPGYGPALETRFAAIVRVGGGSALPPPVDWPHHHAYRGLPDPTNATPYTSATPALISRTAINWANDAPYTVGALVDRAVRRDRECAARLLTLQFIYYMQTHGQPDWSVADDEGFETPYNLARRCPEIPEVLRPLEQRLALAPYVRESVRVVGITTLTAAQLYREGSPAVARTRFPHSLAVGDYPVDLHACRAATDLEAGLDAPEDVPSGWVAGPFQVPFEVFVPATVDGLVVAEKNLSVSRLAAGAIRLQPITMLTGQAAGALAALAVSSGVAPRDVDPLRVQWVLATARHRLAQQAFGDVPRTDPRWGDVQLVATRELMQGYGHDAFGPRDTLPRWQAAVALARLFGYSVTPTSPAASSFRDLAGLDPVVVGSIEALYAHGLTAGCSASPRNFCPATALTRAEAAVLLARGLGLGASSTPSGFTDVAGHWAAGSIQALAEGALVDECASGRYCPNDPTDRVSMARFVARALLRRHGIDWRRP